MRGSYVLASNNINRRGSFLEGAFILTVSTAFVKLAGLLFTFPIARIIHTSGMGVFYSAYDIYNMFAVLASAGLPVAVSRDKNRFVFLFGQRDQAVIVIA